MIDTHQSQIVTAGQGQPDPKSFCIFDLSVFHKQSFGGGKYIYICFI